MNGLRSRIIPSLLMDEGRLIKTKQFKDPKYVGDPINAVKIFNEKRVDELAIFDIGAWKAGEPNFRLLEKISNEARMPLCYGGGIHTADQAAHIIGLGFEKISISCQALVRPALITEIASRIGSQSTVVTLDVKKRAVFGGWGVFIKNGRVKAKTDLADILEMAMSAGAGEIVVNSIDREGSLDGYDLELARFVAARVNTPFTMLGGAGLPEHMSDLIDVVGIVGAGAGSMFVFKGIHRAVLISYTRP
jgi:imidazole glycerol-phosphate synthase subunit HisF